jgi:signal peptidase I
MADSAETLVVALSVWLLAYIFLGHGTKIYGSSMEPTFSDQQCVFTDTLSYKLSDPARGDVISLHAPPAANCVSGTGCDFFKRIIGLPNESIEIRNGAFYINGSFLTESYLPFGTWTEPGPFSKDRPYLLASDEYFVAGDNRDHSADSRFFGPIKRDNIDGKAIFRYCPPEDFGPLEKASY